MDINYTPLHSSILDQNPVHGVPNPLISIPGKYKAQNSGITLDEDILSKHLLLIGGTGCGKSNVFYHIVSQLKKKISIKDVMIIFDTKGDFLNLFGKGDDLLIGNSFCYVARSSKWNIFKEIVADGWDDERIEQNAQEISWSIFRESIEKSKDPFFPNAEKDLFTSVVMCMLKNGKQDPNYIKDFFYNSELKRSFDESTIMDIKRAIETQPSLSSVLSYIGDGTGGQALGVYAELLGTFRKLFTGIFADRGLFSIRDFVKEKGGRVLYIEYDLSLGNILAPMYSLLFDLALKEALGRSNHEGNVFLICDEFKLLPYLQHIEDGVNFGRSLGVKVIAGLQSINQLTEIYDEYRGKNIAAGFSTIFAFKANDVNTREYITNLYGKNVVLEQYKTITNSIHEERRNANVVEDWELVELKLGEAVIGYPFEKPFKYQFDLYTNGGK